VVIASGLNADTGQPCGVCVQARATATFAFAKPGHFLTPGAALTGKLHVVDIGIPDHIAHRVAPRQRLLDADLIRDLLPRRHLDAHKGTAGHLLVAAGSPGKTGAAAMTATAAVRTGAGLVTLAAARGIHGILESQVLEAMTAPLPDDGNGLLGPEALEPLLLLARHKDCLAIGPGLGTAGPTRDLVAQVVGACPCPLVIDADGLNNLSGQCEVLRQARSAVVLTPHPGEMARLLNTTTAAVQQDRPAAARSLAADTGATVVLKGARTVIAGPHGRVAINPTGNPGMASGGMGDVLTGMLGALVCQGLTLEHAAWAGVYLHGAAADRLQSEVGPVGYLASEVMHAVPRALQDLLAER
jgi:NAD(P)H-hydrate epimerase